MPQSDTAKLILCHVTDRRALGAPNDQTALAALRKKILLALRAEVDWLQIRERDLPGRALFNVVREAVECAARCRILVNDRLDVAIAAGAAGVHLGGESLPAKEVIEWNRAGHAPADFLVGRSCHSLEEARAAEGDGADYVFFGPVFASPAKAQYGAPQGIGKLAEVCRSVRRPVLAIGGITVENAADCRDAGAAGIAAIRMFQDAADVAAVISQLRSL